MIVKENKYINIYTTPKELREMADEMEKEWEKSQIGDSLISHEIVSNDNKYEIHFIINQEEMKN